MIVIDQSKWGQGDRLLWDMWQEDLEHSHGEIITKAYIDRRIALVNLGYTPRQVHYMVGVAQLVDRHHYKRGMPETEVEKFENLVYETMLKALLDPPKDE